VVNCSHTEIRFRKLKRPIRKFILAIPLFCGFFDVGMIEAIIKFTTDPVVIFLALFILLLGATQKNKRYKFYLNGRLANQHAIHNLLFNSIAISVPEKQADYLQMVSRLVKYSFDYQDKHVVPVSHELEQCNTMISAHAIANEIEINFQIQNELSSKELEIPPFTFLTIIENALKHGMQGNQPNLISLRIFSFNENCYCASFKDYPLPSELELRRAKERHGLYLLKKRLDYLHEDKRTHIGMKKQIYRKDDILNIIIPR